jgi:precorrin-6A/cobalt-precorrin-6A reductase
MDSQRFAAMSLCSEMVIGSGMRILILGGTSEARELGRLLATNTRFEPVLSLAGRTRAPAAQAVPTRVGGFGGAEGLAAWLDHERTDAVVDATHPFAVNISANAVAATRKLALPLGSIVREPWIPTEGDDWKVVADPIRAAAALGEKALRVLLTVGRLELSAFTGAPQHDYIARTIDPAGDIALPPRIAFIAERPPFDFDAERSLMQCERIDVLVSKNSGSPETYPKLAAARDLGIPVVMIDRPAKPAGVPLRDAAAALAWLESLLPPAHDRSERGV